MSNEALCGRLVRNMKQRRFTPREANAILPFIREDILKLQQAKNEFIRKALALRKLRLKQERGTEVPSEDAIFELEASMEFLQMEAKVLTDSIRLKGAELKDVDIGLVDFPAIINGEEVLLCWRLGEESIQYYHGRDDGFRGRRALPEQCE